VEEWQSRWASSHGGRLLHGKAAMRESKAPRISHGMRKTEQNIGKEKSVREMKRSELTFGTRPSLSTWLFLVGVLVFQIVSTIISRANKTLKTHRQMESILRMGKQT
jgi:hypothetical protein